MTKPLLPPRPGRPAAAASHHHSSIPASRSSEEPRTGVVRKAVLPEAVLPEAMLPEAPASSASGIRPGLKLRRARAWRCLEADPRRPAERPPEEAMVSTAQLSFHGERLRHSGPHEWLPDATEFVHRASHLIARGLGFELCRGVCLQGAAAVLSVSIAGSSTVMGVAGPARAMANVLRQRGLR